MQRGHVSTKPVDVTADVESEENTRSHQMSLLSSLLQKMCSNICFQETIVQEKYIWTHSLHAVNTGMMMFALDSDSLFTSHRLRASVVISVILLIVRL